MTRGYRCRTSTQGGTIKNELQMFLDVFLVCSDVVEGGDAAVERGKRQDER